MHFSYDCAPQQLYDQNLLNQAKSTMSQSQFEREFGATYSQMIARGILRQVRCPLCTVPDGEFPSIEVKGSVDSQYILAFDPSWSQTESSDDFAIQILKTRTKNNKKQLLVHSYALAGTSLKASHMRYFLFCLENFNIVAICGDYNGGVQFLQACNESETFKRKDIKLKLIEAPFDKPEEYQEDLRRYKQQYNKGDYKHVILRKPTSHWIRQG